MKLICIEGANFAPNVCILPHLNMCTCSTRAPRRYLLGSAVKGEFENYIISFCLICTSLVAPKAAQSFCEFGPEFWLCLSLSEKTIHTFWKMWSLNAFCVKAMKSDPQFSPHWPGTFSLTLVAWWVDKQWSKLIKYRQIGKSEGWVKSRV